MSPLHPSSIRMLVVSLVCISCPVDVAFAQLAVPLERSALSLPPDSCIDCDALYAVDCGTGLWKIDPDTGISEFIGTLPEHMDDVAISSDGQLFGVALGSGIVGSLYVISACDALARLVGGLSANGLTGDTATSDLFAQGPPLQRVEMADLFPVTDIGGQLGSDLPDWCGISSGDLAMSRDDGLLYSVLARCPEQPYDDRIVKIDPATGGVVEELGFLPGPLTMIIDHAQGLAFDSQGRLWVGRAVPWGEIYLVDPVTGFATFGLQITGGLDCIDGLAACPLGYLVFGPACDIKPGSDTNPINTRSRGVIPVAILGSSSFDVNDIDPSSVTFGPGGAAPAHSVGIHYEDVDQDGFIDALFHFRTQESGIVKGDEEACISWLTFAGESFSCCDPIRTVPEHGQTGAAGEQGSSPVSSIACGGSVGPMGPEGIFASLLPWMGILVVLVVMVLGARVRGHVTEF